MASFIYALKCPIANVIRYVGKSDQPEKRFRDHIGSANRSEHHTARWLRTVLSAGLIPELIILHRVADGERWQDVERAFIASAEDRGWKLTNSTHGGEGMDLIDPGDIARAQAKRSATLKAFYATPEGAAKMKAISIKGRSERARARRKASLQATYATEEMKRRMSEINREINSRPEVKAAKSLSMKAAHADPIKKARRLATLSSEVARAKMSASAKRRFSKPGSKDYLSTPERRQAASDIAKRRATPQYLAGMAERTRESSNRPEVIASKSAKMKARWADAKLNSRLGHKSHTDEGRKAMSEKTKARWADPVYKARMVLKLIARWADPKYKAKVRLSLRRKKS